MTFNLKKIYVHLLKHKGKIIKQTEFESRNEICYKITLISDLLGRSYDWLWLVSKKISGHGNGDKNI